MARTVVAAMTVLTDALPLADRRLDQVPTLLALAKELGCKVVFSVGLIGSYAPDEEHGRDADAGVIVVDAFSTRAEAVRRLVHEIGHHLLYFQYVVATELLAARLETLGPAEEVEERICRAAEDLVMALPGGIQRDGRIAVPRGDGRVRAFKRLPIPDFMSLSAEEVEYLTSESRPTAEDAHVFED